MQPTRPSRAVRPRQDENAIPSTKAVTQKAIGGAAAPTAGAIKAAVAKENTMPSKAEPKRKAFGDVSNVPKQQQTAKAGLKDDKPQKVVLKEKDQIAVKNALSKPAQRGAGMRSVSASAASTAAAVTAAKAAVPAARRAIKKTEVYADKRPSPPKAVTTGKSGVTKSPKSRTGAIIRRESRKVGQVSSGKGAALRGRRINISAYSQIALSHVQDDVPEAADETSESEDTDEDATDVEEETQNTADISSEGEYDEEDEDDFTTARTKGLVGDNTTGITAPILLPKFSASDKKELLDAGKEFSGVDEDDVWDITMVAEYGDEIFEYMRTLETKMLPNANYMDIQPEIQWSMRAILMDWIVQVHHRFNLLPETLFLCCNYIDRFLSSKVVSIGKLQLVGATALFVAAKYEEIQCPSVHEIVFMVDDGYTVEEILSAERFMLSMLQFELGWPGPMSFLRRVSKADDYDLETRTLAKYFLEITIMDERFVGSPSSFLAAGAHWLARSMLRKGEWTAAHTYFSGYTASQLRPLVRTMAECCENPKNHHSAVYDKYQDKRYKRASLYVEKFMASDAKLDALTDEED
ncbi:cyclin-like protein [Peziza echinospora]|nr:cyclin-like protein [Peziza echinospora]